MKREPDDIRHILDAAFGGNLLYMQIHKAEDTVKTRPAAQIFGNIPPEIQSADPRSLSQRAHSGLHLAGLLHHAPEPKTPGGR